MFRVETMGDLYLVGKALNSQVRLRILRLLDMEGSKTMSELARYMGLTNPAITRHMKVLEASGLVTVDSSVSQKGIRRRCSLTDSQVRLSLQMSSDYLHTWETEIPVGSYFAWEGKPTCGLATVREPIGRWDIPGYFDDPQCRDAGILWLTEGYVEYRLPNYLEPGQRIVELRLTQELGAEAPGYQNHWPSMLHFSLNGVEVGKWLAQGDFGRARGTCTPNWWPRDCNQFGVEKTLTVNDKGSFLDGVRVSDITLGDLGLRYGESIRYRLSAPDSGPNQGGMTLFGSGFGNFGNPIRLSVAMEYPHDSDPGEE